MQEKQNKEDEIVGIRRTVKTKEASRIDGSILSISVFLLESSSHNCWGWYENADKHKLTCQQEKTALKMFTSKN